MQATIKEITQELISPSLPKIELVFKKKSGRKYRRYTSIYQSIANLAKRLTVKAKIEG